MKPIGSKWVYYVKLHSDGSLEQYKVRLVTLGNLQEHGIHYDEKFAPVTKMTTVRLLLSLVASQSWSLYQIDVKNVFLRGDLKGDIYMKLPSVGEHRYVLDNFKNDFVDGPREHEVGEFDAPSEVRALIEGQMLSMRAHAEKIGMPSPPRRIIATGGASANNCILSFMASIFGCNVYTVQKPDSASLGAALRAAHGWLCKKKEDFVPISCMYINKLEKTSLNCKLAATAGDQDLVSKYALLMKKRVEIENRLVQKLGRL